MPKNTTKKRGRKPAKPSRDFPLFAHDNGQWCKKVKGKQHHFGPWSDPQGALERWLEDKDALLAGRTPRRHLSGLVVRDVVNRYLTAKAALLESGELAPRTLVEYRNTCERIVKVFGRHRPIDDLRPEDFTAMRARMARDWGPVRLGNEVQRVRSVFKYAYDADLIDKPVKFGPDFKKPSRKTVRKARAARGALIFEADEIRALIDAAEPWLRAMILMGINTGFGNSDLATLPFSALDLRKGWVDYPRPKTGIPRLCPLWPETVEAMKAAIAVRPEPQDERHADLVFISKYGRSLGGDYSHRRVSGETAKLLKSLGMHRKGVNFYSLRRTFETIGGDSLDQVAVDSIMGHAPSDNDMGSVYRQRVSDDRLQAVTDHVRTWLFGDDVGSTAIELEHDTE